MKTMRSAASLLAIALMACGGDDAPTGSTSNQISVLDAQFSPSATTVTPGTTVTWNWGTTITHNVTFTNASLGTSGDKSSGSYAKAFPTAGTFGYGCTIHAGMTGSVIVQ